jgi:hypothetical protein
MVKVMHLTIDMCAIINCDTYFETKKYYLLAILEKKKKSRDKNQVKKNI